MRQDCEGVWSPCSELCEAARWRQWIEHRPPSGGGAPCPSAADCQPGEGGCQAVDNHGEVDDHEAEAMTRSQGIVARNSNAEKEEQKEQKQEGAVEITAGDDSGEQTSHRTQAVAESAPPQPLASGEVASLAAFRKVAKQYQTATGTSTAAGAVGELTPQSVNNYLQMSRPFVVFLLCSCERDTDWHIQALSDAVRKRPELHQLSLVWANPLTIKRFQLTEMYGVAPGEPALVIDNIPYGPMNERYVFKRNKDNEEDTAAMDGNQPIIVRNPDTHGNTPYTSDSHRPAPGLQTVPRSKPLLDDILEFLGKFVDGSLIPDMRTAPAPDGGAARGPTPGGVTEVVGSTFELLVRDWVPAVPPLTTPGTHQPKVSRTRAHGTRWTFMFFYSRTCPACNEAMPTIERLAVDLKEYAFLNDHEPARPLLQIARVEKPFNDFAYRGLMITHYPTAYLFRVEEDEETVSVHTSPGETGHEDTTNVRMQAVAYADYSGENAPHDHHHASLDHWEMYKLRHFIEEVVGIPAESQVHKLPPTTKATMTTPQHTVGVDSISDAVGEKGHEVAKRAKQASGKRGAGWSHAEQQLQDLSKKLADPALMGTARLSLERQVQALRQAEKRGWTDAELNKLKRDGIL